MKRVAMLAVMAVGCGGDLESLGEVQGGILLDCPPSGPCPTNSPVIDTYRFHDLNRLGVANAQGLALQSFEVGGKQVGLEVVFGYLVGRRDDGTTLTGHELEGGLIHIVDNAGTEYLMKINSVHTGAYWAALAGTNPPLELYDLSWATLPPGGKTPTDNDFNHVCPEPASENDALGMPEFSATLYEGDRIDADTITVGSKLDPDWFNVGCVGHAVAKLALTGHTEAARKVGFETTTAERTAELKMFAADYCGLGIPFTYAGNPLAWMDDHGTMRIGTATTFEARWTDAGAACLDVPRLGPDVEDSIKKRCGFRPPPCVHGVGDEFDGAHMISANP
jgi:hypothetical protein